MADLWDTVKRARFEAAYRGHYAQVFGLCRRMLGGAADAHDAAQEVFARGYRAFGSYRPEDPFMPWIGAIATHHCIDLLRQRRRLRNLFDDEQEADAVAAPAGNGDATLIAARDAAAVSKAVDALPEKYRLPIVLAYYADASYDDIANALGITRNHVGVLLLRAKRRLRDALHGLATGDLT